MVLTGPIRGLTSASEGVEKATRHNSNILECHITADDESTLTVQYCSNAYKKPTASHLQTILLILQTNYRAALEK